MLIRVVALAACLIPGAVHALLRVPRAATRAAPRRSAVRMGLKLHGSQGSRSPLCNWYFEELGISYDMAPPKPSNHPFGQIPFLTDDGVEVFESGAILLYVADKFDPKCTTAEARAKFTKWVVWANSSLDPICFTENERGQVIGTRLDQPGRAVNTLDALVAEDDYIVGGEFSVADVAVASYLNYVPLFFPNVQLGANPNVVRYMQRCAERPAYAKAFGDGHRDAVLAACERAKSGSGKLFGIF